MHSWHSIYQSLSARQDKQIFSPSLELYASVQDQNNRSYVTSCRNWRQMLSVEYGQVPRLLLN